eukprot:9163457-Heterocapsa_arctica.AAC.1
MTDSLLLSPRKRWPKRSGIRGQGGLLQSVLRRGRLHEPLGLLVSLPEQVGPVAPAATRGAVGPEHRILCPGPHLRERVLHALARGAGECRCQLHRRSAARSRRSSRGHRRRLSGGSCRARLRADIGSYLLSLRRLATESVVEVNMGKNFWKVSVVAF